jgi:CBS domain-containing protein
MLVGEYCHREVVAIPRQTGISEAARLMRQHHVGSLVIVDENDGRRQPVGIVTDRDLVLALMAEGLDPGMFTAGDIMSVELVLASPDMDAMEAVSLMRSNRLRRLVIADDEGRLVGIVTLEDLLELMAQELAALATAAIGARDREFEQRR